MVFAGLALMAVVARIYGAHSFTEEAGRPQIVVNGNGVPEIAQVSSGHESSGATVSTGPFEPVRQDFHSLHQRMLVGDSEAGRLLYRSLSQCQAVPLDFGAIPRWRDALDRESDAFLAAKLRTRLGVAERFFARCAAFTSPQRAKLQEVLEFSAASGDAEAAVRLLQIADQSSGSDPLAQLAQAERGRRVVELAMSIVRNGDATVLSELSDAYASGRLGRPNPLAAYEALFASALATEGEVGDPFQSAVGIRLAALREVLSESEAQAAESSAELLIEACCSKSKIPSGNGG